MLKAYINSIGEFPRYSLVYAAVLLLIAVVHRMVLWTPIYVLFGAPIFFGFLALLLLTLLMFLYVIGAFFESGYVFAAKILLCALLMLGAIFIVALFDAPTILYAT